MPDAPMMRLAKLCQTLDNGDDDYLFDTHGYKNYNLRLTLLELSPAVFINHFFMRIGRALLICRHCCWRFAMN